MEYATQKDMIKFAKRFSKLKPEKAKTRSNNHEESDLQQACIKWFDYSYPKLKELCFHPANGGNRNIREAARFKKEGVRAGTPDLIILIPNVNYCSLCIELKTPTGKVSESQKHWRSTAIMYQNKYVVVRSFDEFKKEVESYFAESNYV